MKNNKEMKNNNALLVRITKTFLYHFHVIFSMKVEIDLQDLKELIASAHIFGKQNEEIEITIQKDFFVILAKSGFSRRQIKLKQK